MQIRAGLVKTVRLLPPRLALNGAFQVGKVSGVRGPSEQFYGLSQ